MSICVYETDFSELKLVKRGKVRDVYDVGDYLLMVATDRISAFDVIMPDPVPDKGAILTQISLFWFDHMQALTPHHVVASAVDAYPAECRPYRRQLENRSMLVKKTDPLPIECVVRGYISGSGWKSYRRSGTVCGIELPRGLKESDKLPEPIFTPSTKADLGDHDINIDFAEAADRVGADVARRVKDLSLSIYKKGARLAESKGIIIADTKFEFGMIDGDLFLIDEVLTPDSSRFWPRDAYQPGGAQKSYDKQYLRDYLESIEWDKTPPGPSLPADVIENTRKKYMEALKRLTGRAENF